MTRRYEDGLRAAFDAGYRARVEGVPEHNDQQYELAYKQFRRQWGDVPTIRDYAEQREEVRVEVYAALRRYGSGTYANPVRLDADKDLPDDVIAQFHHLHVNGQCVKNRYVDCNG